MSPPQSVGSICLSEQRGNFLRAGGRFGWQFLVMCLIECSPIDEYNYHQSDRGPDPDYIPDMDQERQANACKSHDQKGNAHNDHGRPGQVKQGAETDEVGFLESGW